LLRAAIVEDSHPVRVVWRDLLLQIGGIEISGEYIRASTAIDGIRANPPDIVLLDIQLENSTGFEVLKMVSAEYPRTRVIVITNYIDDVYRQKYMAAGAYAFCDKNRELRRFRKLLEDLAGSASTATDPPPQGPKSP